MNTLTEMAIFGVKFQRKSTMFTFVKSILTMGWMSENISKYYMKFANDPQMLMWIILEIIRQLQINIRVKCELFRIPNWTFEALPYRFTENGPNQ